MCTNNCSVSVTIMDLIYNKTTISNTLKKIIITKVGRGKSKKGVLIKKIEKKIENLIYLIIEEIDVNILVVILQFYMKYVHPTMLIKS